MAIIETWFDQDLKKAVKVRYIDGNVFSQDNNGNLIGVNVYSNGEPVTLGGSISASVIRADGVTIAIAGNSSGNTASVVLPQTAYAVPGVLSVVIKHTDGASTSTICAVVGNVYQSTTDTVVDPGTIIPSIGALIAEIDAAIASVPADYSSLWSSLAPVFSTSYSYVPGDFVTYNGALYICTTAHSGTWNASHFIQTNIGDNISDAKNAISYVADLNGETTGENYSPWMSGYTLNTAGKIGSSGYYSACPVFIRIPDFINTITITTGESYGAIACRYSQANENNFVDRFTYTRGDTYTLDVSEYKYIRIAIGSTNVSDVGTVSFVASYTLKNTIDNLSVALAAAQAMVDKALTTDYEYATGIPTSTDYDDLITDGNYYIGSASGAQGMTNCPVKVAHRLIVLTTTDSARIWQIIIPNADADIWCRTNNGSWNSWYKIITTRTGIESNDIRITTDNYSELLPDLNTANDNVVYSIAPNVPILNMPEGNFNVAGAGQTYGIPSGTLVTIRGANIGGNYEKFQIFMTAAGLPEGYIGSLINFRGCRYSGGQLVWDHWSKMGNGVNLRATNTFIQESRIQAGTAMFSDMNDAPNNTIVQIDLDAVSMANNPFRGHSCVLITFSPSYISRHGMLQLCSGIEGGYAHLFFRYGWQNNPGEIRWAPWMECTATEATMPD